MCKRSGVAIHEKGRRRRHSRPVAWRWKRQDRGHVISSSLCCYVRKWSSWPEKSKWILIHPKTISRVISISWLVWKWKRSSEKWKLEEEGRSKELREKLKSKRGELQKKTWKHWLLWRWQWQGWILLEVAVNRTQEWGSRQKRGCGGLFLPHCS